MKRKRNAAQQIRLASKQTEAGTTVMDGLDRHEANSPFRQRANLPIIEADFAGIPGETRLMGGKEHEW